MSNDKTHWAGRLGRWVRLHLLRALRENASPGRTALGFAIGAFIGVVPSFMVGGPLAFFLAGRLGWNRAAAMDGLINNLSEYALPYLVGNAVLALAIAVVFGLVMFFLVRQKGPRGMRAMIKSQRVRTIPRATAGVEESAEVRQTP